MSREEILQVFMASKRKYWPAEAWDFVGVGSKKYGFCGEVMVDAAGNWIDANPRAAAIIAEALKRIKEAQ